MADDKTPDSSSNALNSYGKSPDSNKLVIAPANTLNFDYNPRGQRITTSAQLGAALSWKSENTTVYAGAGAKVEAGVNVTPQLGPPSDSSAVPTYPDKINAPQAYKLFGDISAYTNGTYDLKKLSLRQTTDLVNRYPAAVTKNTHTAVDQMNENVTRVTNAIDHAQQQLVRLSQSENFSRLPQELQQRLLSLTANQFDPGRFEAITIGQVYDVAKQIKDMMDEGGGAKAIGQTVASQLPAKANIPESRVTSVTNELNNLYAMVSDVVKQVDRLPSPQAMKDNYDYVKNIVEYDPAVKATAYVAAGASYEFAPGKHGMLGASYGVGQSVTPDNMFKVRLPNGKTTQEIIPSHDRNKTIAIGFGTNPAAATSPDLASKLNLSVAHGTTEIGAYLEQSNTKKTLLGDLVKNETKTTLAGQVARGISSNGGYAFVSIGVERRHDPLVPNVNGNKTTITLGAKL